MFMYRNRDRNATRPKRPHSCYDR